MLNDMTFEFSFFIFIKLLKLPLDDTIDFDLIKFEALVANDPMVHHLILFACDFNENIEKSVIKSFFPLQFAPLYKIQQS